MEMTLRSLKPINLTVDDKAYAAYKTALDHCFNSDEGINNIGVVGDYGTGKTTVIDSYIKGLDESKYDVIRVSMLTLDKKTYSNIDILKNIIKQVVHKPRKPLKHNILKYQPFKITAANIIWFTLLVVAFVFAVVSNRSLFSTIPILDNLSTWPLEALKGLRYLALIAIGVLFLYQIYQIFLQGIGLRKLKIASTLDVEAKRRSEDIVNEELEYLEYLIYLLKRDHSKNCRRYEHDERCRAICKKRHSGKCIVKTLVFVIEDLDRFGNLQVFQQLREVNNLLNDRYEPGGYKFIYAVGNELFAGDEATGKDNTDDRAKPTSKDSSDDRRKPTESVRISFKSNSEPSYRENAAKFFDFILNIIPVMDSSNSYEYFRDNFRGLVGDGGIADEDLYMLCQYIRSPRVLIDVAHDFQMMKGVKKDDAFALCDTKRLYYAILKSTLYNFYKVIHDVFEDLEAIAKHFNNKDAYKNFEERRAEEFVKLCLLYALESNQVGSTNKDTLISTWDKIKTENDALSIGNKYGNHTTINAYRNSIELRKILDFAHEKSQEYIFSADAFMSKTKSSPDLNTFNYTEKELISQYYESDNDNICKIIKHVETARHNDPNKVDFSIKEFLDNDLARIGIKEGWLDIHDYNSYVTLDYFSAQDSEFLSHFNINDFGDKFITRKLTDIDAVVSKMRLDKIEGFNGLNVHIIKHLQNNDKSGPKVERFYRNAIKSSYFLNFLLYYSFEKETCELFEPVTEPDGFDRGRFIVNNTKFIGDNTVFYGKASSVDKILHWFDSHPSLTGVGGRLIAFLSELNKINNDTLKIHFIDTNYSSLMYAVLLNHGKSKRIMDEETLLYILSIIVERGAYKDLANPVFYAYRHLIIKPDVIPHHKWLSLFNDSIAMFMPSLDSANLHVIRSVYEAQHGSSLVDEKIKVYLLSDIPKDETPEKDEPFKDFLATIYQNNIYEYNANNIITLFKHFEDGTLTDYMPFAKYSQVNFELLKYYREVDVLGPLDHEKPWISQMMHEILTVSPLDDLAGRLQFFVDYDSFKIDVLPDLKLDNDGLKILLGFASLYAHTYNNLEYAYGYLVNVDLDLFKQIVASPAFDFATLYNDVEILNQNPGLSSLIYDELYRSESITLKLFEQYMRARPDKLHDASILASQQDKLMALFKMDRVEMNQHNLRQCSPRILQYLYVNKGKPLNNTLAKLSDSDILEITKGFGYKGHVVLCLESLFLSELIDEQKAISLTIGYLQNYEDDDIITTITRLLTPLIADTDIERIVSLLEKNKGQRTVTTTHLNLLSFLSEKGIITYHETKPNTAIIKI